MPKRTFADIAVDLLANDELELAADVLTLADEPFSEDAPVAAEDGEPFSDEGKPESVDETSSEEEPEPLLSEEPEEEDEADAVLKGEDLYNTLEGFYDSGKGGEVNGVQIDKEQAELVLTVADKFQKQINRLKFLSLPIKDMLQKAEQLAY